MFRKLRPVVGMLVVVSVGCADEPVRVSAPAPAATVTVRPSPEPAPTVTIIERTVRPSPEPEPVEPAVEGPVYVAPDPATVARMVKGVFRERLNRDPDQAEMRWHLDWYMAEDRQGGDTDARWLEMFEREYAAELDFVADKQREQERRERQQQCREDYYEQHGTSAPGHMCMGW